VLGLFGFLASLKHYERSRLHVSRMRAVRRALQAWFKVPLLQIEDIGKKMHEARFPIVSKEALRLHYVWQGFHALVMALGVLLLAIYFKFV
jgi:hypothetical protein